MKYRNLNFQLSWRRQVLKSPRTILRVQYRHTATSAGRLGSRWKDQSVADTKALFSTVDISLHARNEHNNVELLN